MNAAAHGQWKQNTLHGVLLSGKWDTFACAQPGVWAGLWDSKVTLTYLPHGPPCPTLWLWDAGPEAAGVTEALRGRRSSRGEGALLLRGTHSTQLPRLITPHVTEETRLKGGDATCGVYPVADEL